ncbi:hypothetical protein OIV83_000168 [Microbotryomycetes sp. JL201]|nr:hypothetical protein OIV83_000168 [Microbotryomycetes sp. JL201]
MVPGRPKFSLHDNSFSSSPSRETDLEQGRPPSPPRRKHRSSNASSSERETSRRRSFGSKSPPRRRDVIYEHEVFEPEACADDDLPTGETQPLLNGSIKDSSSFQRLGATKRNHRLSGTNLAQYGSLDSPSKGHFLPLNAAEEGRPLQRTNSILRASEHD